MTLAVVGNSSAEPSRMTLAGHVPKIIARLTPVGQLPATTNLSLAIGLPLRNEAVLDEFLRQLQDPHSTNYHRYLTPAEFTARFGPTEAQYQSVIRFAASNGFTVFDTHPNRVVLDVEGSVSNVERAFQLVLRTYRHPAEPRDFFAPDRDPSVPVGLPVVDIEGLSDYGRPRPLARPVNAAKIRPLSFTGSGPNGEYAGKDFRNAYAPGTALTGAGQAVGLLEFSDYYPADITNYENNVGMTNYVALTNVVVGHPAPGTANNIEVALDIEVAIAMAPGLSRVIVYEENSVSPSTILSRIANDNLAKQVSCSWTWSGGPSSTVDGLFKQMASQGQSFFQAAGDSDAYTGSNVLDSTTGIVAPVDSTNITTVGGVSLTMTNAAAAWGSETVWNYNLNGIPNEGSGGGISSYYTIPWWQTNVSMAANQGSTAFRNLPDVALTADNIYACYNNGTTNGASFLMGTSAAAPLWAGFCALVNQQSVASSGTTVGFLNPALYAIAAGTNYAACFHDTTTGNNIGTNAPGFYYAAAGYDLCTGLGTPTGTNLINLLAPPAFPYFASQPASQTVTNGNNVRFSVTAGGQLPLSYRWRFNGTNLPAGGNISGTTSNVLTITAVTTANAGNYSVAVTNTYGAVTSSVAVLTVVLTASSVALNSSENPSGYHDSIQFIAGVTPAGATGTVQFLTNGAAFDTETLASGQATSVRLASLPRGTNTITAIYSGNANVSPATNTLAQTVTNHPPAAATEFYTRAAGSLLNIAVTNLAAYWSDADGDTVSLAAIGISTNGVTVTNNTGTLVYASSNNVADQFVCTVTDGWGGTNFQTVNISVVSPNIVSVAAGANGGVTLDLTGAPDYSYILQATTNLAPAAWQALATNTLGTNGLWQFTDLTATNYPQRFYQLKLAP